MALEQFMLVMGIEFSHSFVLADTSAWDVAKKAEPKTQKSDALQRKEILWRIGE
ncbi:MAG: hypothetical protein ACTSYL_09285 [Candidatus Thorarchaeota archaeon]